MLLYAGYDIIAVPVSNEFATVINVDLCADAQEIIPDPNAQIHFLTGPFSFWTV